MCTRVAILLAALTLRAAAQAADTLWLPHLPIEAAQAHANPHDALRGRDMRCIHSTPHLAGCLMKDLYYDRKAKTFLFFGRKIDDSDEDRHASSEDIERRFREHMTRIVDVATEWSNITFLWSSRPPPRPSKTCRVTVPTHLRQEWRIGTHSIGHLLRDNYQPLVAVPLQFGLTAASFAWVAWPRFTGWNANELTHVQLEYNSWLSMHPPYKWSGLEKACAAGELGTGPGLPERKSKPRYVHIESALASGSSVRWTRHGSKTRICSRAHWQAQRDHAYHLNGMTHTPVRAQARMLISVLYKPKEDKRRMLISEPVLRAVRERYPDADIEVHDAMAEKPDVQLRWLGRTTILITNIGSASFRLLYLPDGAQVIMVGPLEGEAIGRDGKPHYAEQAPFGEIDDCWRFLPHLTMHQYHIMNSKDVMFDERLEFGSFGSKERNWEALRIRNAHVHVRAERLLGVLQEAAARVQEQQGVLSTE